MVQSLTAADQARRVLDIYKHFNAEAGHALRANNFVAVAARRNWSTKGISEGIQYAVHQGWIEELSTGGLKLTSAGYAAM